MKDQGGGEVPYMQSKEDTKPFLASGTKILPGGQNSITCRGLTGKKECGPIHCWQHAPLREGGVTPAAAQGPVEEGNL